ncbi:MAG TPA: hypothetical protein VGO59_00320 [Verrucomicrobiae bacterium]|jgi:hypothetical protein
MAERRVVNNSELDAILRKVRVPEPAPDFWETLPRLAANRSTAPRVPCHRTTSSWLKWAWAAGAFAAVVAAIVVIPWPSHERPSDLLASAKLVDEMLALFPSRLRAIVEDEKGMRVMLSDQRDVPASPPLYVRICDGHECASLVTFSGQEVQMAGRNLTVLSDTRGGIILEGKDLLWSSAQSFLTGKHLTIVAKSLDTTSM